MKERVCKNCGGRSYKVVGQNMVKCMFCGTLFVDDERSKEEEVLVVQANQLLRQFKFSEAIKQFNKILSTFPMSYESYFGRMLARNKIVLYSNKRGSSQNPRFFGEVKSVSQDEDFLSALENAPDEVQKTYKDFSRKVDKIANNFKALTETSDVFVLPAKKDGENQKFKDMISSLEKQYYKTFVFEGQKEEHVAKALQTAKVFLFVINSNKNFLNGDIKNIYDRYLYFISERKKAKQSYILILDKIDEKDLPPEIVINKSIFDMSSISFLEDILHKTEKESVESVKKTAKIETVEIKNEAPNKVEYVDVETIEPTELGNYEVENLKLSETNKIKWIFLTLKHGDFVTAREMTKQELENDPNNAELLFAQLMINKNVKTEEEFFQNISNFDNKEIIDKILTYASKDFAENFVNKWEELLINLDNEDYFNTYLLYLAKYSSEKRSDFVTSAEKKAIETMNEELIEKVAKCFEKNDIDRFVNFYFALAQKSDNQDYYNKVLSIDEGHEQSNLILLLQKYKTAEDKLSYRNREEVENVLKFLSVESQNRFIGAIINMVMPIAFFDVKKACEQLDFYLSYVQEPTKLADFCADIGQEFLNMEFFEQAEKYFSIAVSKFNKAEYYWELIKAKSHCKTEQELVLTNVKITAFAEWETLLSLSEDDKKEHYAEVVSKINLYKGNRKSIKNDLLDKVDIVQKIEEFLSRNQKILLEAEKEGFANGINYFKIQFQPFNKYLNEIKNVQSFEEYSSLVSRLDERLEAMDLTLDMSVNLTQIQYRETQMKSADVSKSKVETKRRKKIKEIKRDVFLKRFCYIFLEICPLLFIAGLFVFLIANPKETYLYFNQTFFVVSLLISVGLLFLNLIFYTYAKKDSFKSKKIIYLLPIILGVLNFMLFCVGFYYMPKQIEITNAKELQTLIQNAPHTEFVLNNDIDMSEIEWRATNFSGKLDGKGFALENITFKNGGLFANNNGEILNLTLTLSEKTYQSNKFGAIALKNTGKISECKVYAKITINCDLDCVVGGIVAENSTGEILDCYAKIELLINSQCEYLNVGGIVGNLNRSSEAVFTQNQSDVNFVLSGSAQNANVGGLVGVGQQASENNFSTGNITSDLTGEVFVGGLYGRYKNTQLSEAIKTSYSTVDIQGTAQKGSLIGELGGVVENCFSIIEGEFYAKKIFDQAIAKNCKNSYSSDLNFDENIWDLSQTLPTLK